MATRAATASKTLRLHREHKIAIGFVAIAAAAYFGYQAFAAYQVDRIVFPQLKPGRMSIVGITTGAGYRIIVSNQVAQLVQTQREEFAENYNYDAADDSDANKKRVPLRELLETLQGDEKALGEFVTSMNNDLKRAEMPPLEVLWDAADVKKAIEGDPVLKPKLEADLNVRLDGSPLDKIRPQSLQNGIVIVCRVPVKVSVEGSPRTMLGEVKIPFKPRFVVEVETRYEKEFEVRPETIKGHYLDVAREIQDKPGSRQNVGAVLLDLIGPKSLESEYALDPERILSNSFIALNDSFVESASFREIGGAEGKKLYNIDIELNDEGRRRLWQYSRRHQGSQLLFIVDGIAIAAPRIRHELAQSTISITQIPDRSLVEDAVDIINESRKNAQ